MAERPSNGSEHESIRELISGIPRLLNVLTRNFAFHREEEGSPMTVEPGGGHNGCITFSDGNSIMYYPMVDQKTQAEQKRDKKGETVFVLIDRTGGQRDWKQIVVDLSFDKRNPNYAFDAEASAENIDTFKMYIAEAHKNAEAYWENQFKEASSARLKVEAALEKLK